jgi:hypothetical protein
VTNIVVMVAKRVKTKQWCCQGRPSCKRCPVVLLRLENAGKAERTDRRTYVVRPMAKRDIKAARRALNIGRLHTHALRPPISLTTAGRRSGSVSTADS